MNEIKISTLHSQIISYNSSQIEDVREICDFLSEFINGNLNPSENKLWHGGPVWFINGNPIVSYTVRKSGKVALMFFSGQSFNEPSLVNTGKFKAAEILYSDIKEINIDDLKIWLNKSGEIQWDYKNIIKRKGVLVKLT